MYRVEKINDNIVIVKFSSQFELTSTLLRFQEFYESPKFKGKIFTLGEFRSWYAKENGSFTYYEDWTGFNIPSYILDTFRSGLFDPLTEKEEEFLDSIPARLTPFYIIAISENGENATEHEICHALYYTNQDYKEEVDKELYKNKDLLSGLKKYLLKIGYCNEVLDDEVHAYICEDSDYLKEKEVDFPNELVTILRKIKRKYHKNKLKVVK